MTRSRALSSLGAALLVAAADVGRAFAQGCAMCQASMPGAEDPLSQGFNYSMFVFLGVTYGLVGAVGGWIGYRYWRADTAGQAPRVLPFQPVRKEDHP